jgi:acetylornithine deacetylase
MTKQEELLQRAVAHINSSETIAMLQRAVQTPSITGDEAAIGTLFLEELAGAGVKKVNSFQIAENRPNIEGFISGTGGGNSLMLLGHTDTVHVEGWREEWADTEREDPFGGVIVDGDLYGRGAGDMKAGIVTIIAALKAIHDAGLHPKGDIVTLFVVDEESGQPGSGLSLGMKAAVERIRTGDIPRTDFAIYTEPTALKIYAAQMGFIIADITVRGRSAYFGTPWLGNDALRATHRLLTALYDYTDAIWETADHALLGRPFSLVTGINGGGYIAVPDKCNVSLIRKVLPHENLDEVKSQLDGIVQRLAINEGVVIDIEYTASRDHSYGGSPTETDIAHPGLTSLCDAVRSVTGDSKAIEGAPYWSEMSFLNGLDIPTVYCAPGDISNCHTFHERVSVQQLLDGVEIFVRFTAQYCGFEEV